MTALLKIIEWLFPPIGRCLTRRKLRVEVAYDWSDVRLKVQNGSRLAMTGVQVVVDSFTANGSTRPGGELRWSRDDRPEARIEAGHAKQVDFLHFVGKPSPGRPPWPENKNRPLGVAKLCLRVAHRDVPFFRHDEAAPAQPTEKWRSGEFSFHVAANGGIVFKDTLEVEFGGGAPFAEMVDEGVRPIEGAVNAHWRRSRGS